jgi:hypothetical protein
MLYGANAFATTEYCGSKISTAGQIQNIFGPLTFMLQQKCTVKRRALVPAVDILNAPSYGKVINWSNVYVNLPCRLEVYSPSSIQFKPTGERIEPSNILYVDCSTPLKPEDRVFLLNIEDTGLYYYQEFIVQGAVPALTMMGLPQHHLEYNLIVP